MGKSTQYCERSGVRIVEEEFEQGEAIRVWNMNFCDKCQSSVTEVLSSAAEEIGVDIENMTKEEVRETLEGEIQGTKQTSSADGEKDQQEENRERMFPVDPEETPPSETGRHARERGHQRDASGTSWFNGMSGRTLIFIGSVLFIIVLVGGFLFYRQQRAAEKRKTLFVDQRIQDVRKQLSGEEPPAREKLKTMRKKLRDASRRAKTYRRDDIRALQTKIDNISSNLIEKKNLRKTLVEYRQVFQSGSLREIENTLSRMPDLVEKARRLNVDANFMENLKQVTRKGVRTWVTRRGKQETNLDSSSRDALNTSYEKSLDRLQRIEKQARKGIDQRIRSLPVEYWRPVALKTVETVREELTGRKADMEKKLIQEKKKQVREELKKIASVFKKGSADEIERTISTLPAFDLKSRDANMGEDFYDRVKSLFETGIRRWLKKKTTKFVEPDPSTSPGEVIRQYRRALVQYENLRRDIRERTLKPVGRMEELEVLPTSFWEDAFTEMLEQRKESFDRSVRNYVSELLASVSRTSADLRKTAGKQTRRDERENDRSTRARLREIDRNRLTPLRSLVRLVPKSGKQKREIENLRQRIWESIRSIQEQRPSSGKGTWYSDAWKTRFRIAIPARSVETDLYHVPVLISIQREELKTYDPASRPRGFLFTGKDGHMVLDHDVESFDASTGKLVAWVRVPHLSSEQSTVFYLYADNRGSMAKGSPERVWDHRYDAVWHLLETPDTEKKSREIRDHSGGSFHLSAQNLNPRQQVSGKIDGSITFQGNGNILGTDPEPLRFVDGDFTVSFWLKTSSLPNSENVDKLTGFIDHGAWESKTGFQFLDDGKFNERIVFRVYGNDQVFETEVDRSQVNDDEWHQITGVRSGDAIELFLDGKFVDRQDHTNFDRSSGEPFQIGSFSHERSGSELDGSMDEVRIADHAKSQAWIHMNYRNQKDPGSFYRIESVDTFREMQNR